MSKRIVMFVTLLFAFTSVVLSNDIVVSKRMGDGEDASWIYPLIKIQNNGTSAIELSDYEVEYFIYEPEFNVATNASDYFNCQVWHNSINDINALSKEFISVSFKSLGDIYGNTLKKANVKAVIKFNNQTLEPGSFIKVDFGIHKTSWKIFDNKNDDWSYSNSSIFEETDKTVLLKDGQVVWGIDPIASNNLVRLYAYDNGYGSISLNPPGGEYVYGTEVTVTATPNEGYEFDYWHYFSLNSRGEEKSKDAVVTLVMTETQKIMAFFKDENGTTPDPSKYDDWATLSEGSAKVKGDLYVERDINLGARGAGNKFVLHSRNHSGVVDKGDFFELAFEKATKEGEFEWSSGFVMRPTLGKDSSFIGLGTTKPTERLDVWGNIFTNKNKLIVRKNISDSKRIIGLDDFRYYEGVIPGNRLESDNLDWGLNLTSLTWNWDGSKYQDPMTFHAGRYRFFAFNEESPKMEREVFSIDRKGTIKVGADLKDYVKIDSSKIIIEKLGGNDVTLSNSKLEFTSTEDFHGRKDSTVVQPGTVKIQRGKGSWFELYEKPSGFGSSTSAWYVTNPENRNVLEFGWDPDTKVSENTKWQIFNIHNDGLVSIGERDPDYHTDEKLIVAGNAQVTGELKVTGRLNVDEIEGSVKVDQTIEAKEFKVGDWVITDAPDFVFKEDYDLKPLSEVEQFIKKESHLPGIPSAEEIKTEGFDLVKMNMLLLQKVEELTLHSIEQQKQIEKLNSKIEDMQ